MANMRFLANFDGSLSFRDTVENPGTLDSAGTITYAASTYFAGKQGLSTSSGNYAHDDELENANKLLTTAGAIAIRFKRGADLGAFEQLWSVGQSGNSGSHFIGIGINTSDQLYMSHRNGGASATTLTITTPTVPVGTDSFAYGEWNGTAYALYLGTDTTSGTRTSPTQDFAPGDMGFGAYAVGPANPFQGLIDCIAIWDAPLTSTERTNLRARTGAWTWSMDLLNEPPVVNAGADATITIADTFTSTATFTDADSASWTATVDYGEGAGPQAVTPGSGTVPLSNVYGTPGVYTVTVTVTDDDGASDSDTATITVNAAPVTGQYVIASVIGTDESAPVITLT